MKMSTCCDCGYQWPTGTDGGHYCAEVLTEKLKAERKLADRLGEALEALLDNYKRNEGKGLGVGPRMFGKTVLRTWKEARK